jgi:iron complex transport system permease protein
MHRGRIALLVAGLGLALALGLAWGTVPLSSGDAWRALLGLGDPTAVTIIRDIRLPRVVLSVLVGAALGMSGAALQGTLRNALAEPYLLGVSGGAAVGAVIVVALGSASGALLSLAAFTGATVAVGLVLTIARTAGGYGDPRVILMSGVVVGAFANASILVLLANADANSARNALWWMMGSVASADWDAVRWLAGTLLLAGGALLHWAPEVDVLALGEESAASLGVDPAVAGPRLFIIASLLASATVAAAGLVGFVGLIVPHVARSLAGARHRAVFLVAALAGATLVVVADLVARTIQSPAELPLGAVTAILGVPFFLIVLRRLL